MGLKVTPYAQTNIQLYRQLEEANYTVDDIRRVADSYLLATKLFSGQYRGSGKTLLAHLVGTASILARHGASIPVICAGMLHAAYVCGDFGTLVTGATKFKRKRVSGMVREDIEALVLRYASLRCHLWDLASTPERLSRLKDNDQQVLFIRVANDLEETLDSGVAYCGNKKRDSMILTLEVMEVIADFIAKGSLVDELRRARSTLCNNEIPDELQTKKGLTYTILPASTRARVDIALRESSKSLLMIIWRRLPRSFRYALRR